MDLLAIIGRDGATFELIPWIGPSLKPTVATHAAAAGSISGARMTAALATRINTNSGSVSPRGIARPYRAGDGRARRGGGLEALGNLFPNPEPRTRGTFKSTATTSGWGRVGSDKAAEMEPRPKGLGNL